MWGGLTILVFPKRGSLLFPPCKEKHFYGLSFPAFEKIDQMCLAGEDQQSDIEWPFSAFKDVILSCTKFD